MSELALPALLGRNVWLRRLLAPIAFLATFGFFVYLTFPFDTVALRLQSEARKANVELTVESLGPLGPLGMRARGLSIRQPTEIPGVKGPEIKLDRLDVKPELIALVLRRIAIDFALEAYGGEGRGSVRFSNDPKLPGLLALTLDASEVDLKDVPPGLVGEMELLGRLGIKADLTSLNQLETANGTASVNLKGGAVVKGTLKLGEGMGFPLPKVMLGDLSGSITIDKGNAKIDKLVMRGGDVDAEVDGTIRLKPLLSLSQADLKVKLRPQDKWLEQNPLIKSSLGFLGPKGPDGYTLTLTGPLSRLQSRPGR
jgi:type II secretion system protein N